MNTCEYLDAVRTRLNLPSDYALQKPLGLSKSQLSKYRTGRDYLSDDVAMKIADILNTPAWRVLVDIHAEKSKTPEIRAAWTAVLDKLSTSFTDLLLALVCANTMKLRADR